MTSGSAVTADAARAQPAGATMTSASILTGSGSARRTVAATMVSGSTLVAVSAQQLAATAALQSASLLVGSGTIVGPAHDMDLRVKVQVGELLAVTWRQASVSVEVMV
jgi:hypothetical protein